MTNGSIGTIVEILYENPLGEKLLGSLPLYIAVDFLECMLNDTFKYGCPTT